MFKINKALNEIEPLKLETFASLGFGERQHLQEWIAKYPKCLGEDGDELLIIQKEFAGFADTQERLDLLALDKSGNLVIIENKRDDTGRDVTWQALKYASYCGSLTTENIVKIFQEYLAKEGSKDDAETIIADFMGEDDFSDVLLNEGLSQRIILIAANFRKEVTSTVLWLLNYGIKVQCFEAKPFSRGDELFLKIEQIIPVKDTEEFVIGLADKAKSEATISSNVKSRKRHNFDFWVEFLNEINAKAELYKNLSPSEYQWIGASSGVRGVSYNTVVTTKYAQAEIYIDRGKDCHAENRWIFDKLLEQQDAIQSKCSFKLIWERLDERRACRIKAASDGNIFEKERWPEMIRVMIEALIQMEKAFKEPIATIGNELKNKS